jgi:hypothetical protein
MAVVQLASEADVVAALGRALTSTESARVGAILDKASELFRQRSGQQFTPGTSHVRLRVIGDQVALPQRPVVSVTSVTTDDGDDTVLTFGTLFQSKIRLDSAIGVDLVRMDYSRAVLGGSMVRVNYSHGGDVPDLVRLTVADVTRKVLEIDPNAVSGKTQHSETVGPFTEQDTYATWAQGGQTMLAPADADVADSFRVHSYGSVVMVP